LIAKYTVANVAMNATTKGTKLNKAKEAAAQMDEVVVQIANVRRKQDEVLATTGGEKKPKGSGDNRCKDQEANDKDAEPQTKSAHPGKASGTKSASSYGPAREGRGVGDNSNTSKPYWEGRPPQKNGERLNQLGHVISADKLRGPNI
jgi:hypothetical protein